MDKFLVLMFALLLSGCADSEYATRGSVNGVSKPADLMPEPFPDAPVTPTSPPPMNGAR